MLKAVTFRQDRGEVYVTFAIYDAQWTDGEDAIGFAKSTDGGATYKNENL
jgi:hypothetical protein